jgi:transcriptional regulator GlxA family with amidase domain
MTHHGYVDLTLGVTRGQQPVSDIGPQRLHKAAGRRPAKAKEPKAPKTVVFALYDKVTLQDVAAPLEIFARANDFGAKYCVILASPTGAAVDTTSYVSLNVDMPLAEVPDRIDTLIVPGGVPPDFHFTPGEHDIPEEQTPDVVAAALEMVGELAPRARRVASVCTGAFVLAALGLLDGRRATTHWAHCAELARTYPEIEVVPDSLFVQDGPFITGAGITAGIDLGLALVESDYGPDVARRVARWMVVFLQRPGGQAQFSVWTESELTVSGGLREILDAVVADPGADHSIAAMAERAAVSERHLVRMFRVQVGMTPARFVEQARLEAAKVLLATGDHGQEAVARRAGFGSADTMRRTFRRALGVSPSMYRSRFRTTGIHQAF